MSNNSILGRALSIPIFASNGSADVVTGAANVRQAVIQRLGTPIGTLPFNPDFGSRLGELLFEPNDNIAVQVGKTLIRECLNNEGRIRVLQVNAMQDTTTITYSVQYQILGIGEVQTLVFPFTRNT